MSDFFNMGGYGGYVWPTYGIAALVLIAVLFSTLRSLRHSEKTLEGLQASRRRRRRGEGGGEGRDEDSAQGASPQGATTKALSDDS